MLKMFSLWVAEPLCWLALLCFSTMMPKPAYGATDPGLSAPPEIYDIQHFDMHYHKDWYCGHPRRAIYACFDGMEIIVGHQHALCAYKVPSDVKHDFGGYDSRAVVLLQRSTDGGHSWPEADESVVYDEKISDEQKKAFLYQTGAPRENYDMFNPNSLFFFGRTYLQERGAVPICFALRSIDRGRSWEKAPTVIEHPDGPQYWVHKDCHPVVRMPDGKTLLAAMTLMPAMKVQTMAGDKVLPGISGTVAIYSSTDNGLTWKVLSSVVDRSKIGWIGYRFTYAGLLLLPSGELQAYCLHISDETDDIDGLTNAICLFTSKDGGRSWSAPQPIVRSSKRGGACWNKPVNYGEVDNIYRAPWPMLLKDGRILVLFGRRRMPMGIGGLISSDGGKTWSDEFVIRDDGVFWDMTYPVGSELKDGRIFCAYYYNRQDGNALGGTRYLAGTTFRIR